MKKIILSSLLIMICMTGMAQNKNEKKDEISNSEVPAEVKTSLNRDFPTADVKNWEKEGGSYEATFTVGTVKMSAVYSKNGYRKETETAIEESKLPPPVFDYIKNKFSGYVIKNTSKIITDKAVITYEVEIDKDHKTEGLIFDANGKFKKKEKRD